MSFTCLLKCITQRDRPWIWKNLSPKEIDHGFGRTADRTSGSVDKGDKSQSKEIALHLSIPENQIEGKSSFSFCELLGIQLRIALHNEDNLKLLKDSISFIKGTPPLLEGEEDPEIEAKKKCALLIQKQRKN